MTNYRTYRVGRRYYWRHASVVMACHTYNATAPQSEDHGFSASWTTLGPLYVLTVSEYYKETP